MRSGLQSIVHMGKDEPHRGGRLGLHHDSTAAKVHSNRASHVLLEASCRVDCFHAHRGADPLPLGSGETPRDPLFRRILGFAGLPFLSLITPFLFLPILARVAGADAWLAIAVGQSSGGFFGLIVGLGYSTVGPQMVAVASELHRPRLLALSLRARLVVWVPSAALAVTVAVLIAPATHRVEAGSMAVAMTMTGLSSAWYMIGLGRAGSIAIYEIAPRIVATIAAAIVVLTGGPVLWYPILLIVALIASVGTSQNRRRDRASGTWADVRSVLAQAESVTELPAPTTHSL